MRDLALQIKETMKFEVPRFRGYNKIVVCGMGGSGIAGYALKDLIEEMPVFVFQSYELPKFIDDKTLVFLISYSGNTAETISMYKQARKKTKNIAIITSGGILGKEDNTVEIPQGMQPRESLGYLFFSMWKVLGKRLDNVIEVVKSVKSDLGIAKKLFGKIPVIYANSGFYSVALRWKQQINEDSKRLAIANAFPEINHNEIEARYDDAKIVFLKDKEELAIELLKKEQEIVEVQLKGKTKLEKIFYGFALSNFIGLEFAALNKEDYLEYRFIEKLKEEMKKRD